MDYFTLIDPQFLSEFAVFVFQMSQRGGVQQQQHQNPDEDDAFVLQGMILLHLVSWFAQRFLLRSCVRNDLGGG